MLVAIEPPVIGQTYGLGSEDIYHLLLATKSEGQTLWPISRWLTPVYVLRPPEKSVINHRRSIPLRLNSSNGANCTERTKTQLPPDSSHNAYVSGLSTDSNPGVAAAIPGTMAGFQIQMSTEVHGRNRTVAPSLPPG